MAFSILKMAATPPTQFSITKPSSPQLAPRKLPPSQVRCKVNSEDETPKTPSHSRRGAILSLAALSVGGIVVSSPEIAEARISKTEMKRKIIEKLQKLREKAGLDLSKKEETEKQKSPTKKENLLTLEPAPFPLPGPPPLGPRKSVVEVTLS